MILHVTQDDIDRAIRNSADRCPVAVSLTRNGFKNVLVRYENDTDLRFRHGVSYPKQVVILPGIREKIEAWDDGADLAPFSIDLGEIKPLI